MAGGRSRGMDTGLVRRIYRTARFAMLAGALPCLAATPGVLAPAGQSKLSKPSAYHPVEPAPQSSRPLPRVAAAPPPRSVRPQQNPHGNAQQASLPQRNAQVTAHLPSTPQPEAAVPPRTYPTQADRDPRYAQVQPAPEPGQRPRDLQAYAQTPMARPRPMLTAYPATVQPPYARRVLYQGNSYPGNNQRRENGQAATEHLPAWMRKHQNESPAERERSLRQEPGFNRLAPAQQQNLINTLHRLNEMPPEQRERTLMRMENMERLSPQMRDAVRSSARQLSDLPPDRRRLWQKAFRDLRDMPPEQRQEVLRSPEFAGQFSAQERSIMGNLLAVEPYRNPGPVQPPLYGK
jgi:hypothetical protein